MLIFSKHALIRIVERKIDPNLISNTIEDPDRLDKENGEYKAIKLLGDKVMIVVYTENNGILFIITLWESNKIKKYLR